MFHGVSFILIAGASPIKWGLAVELQALLATRVFATKLFVADAIVFGFQLIALGAALFFQFFFAHGFFAGLAFQYTRIFRLGVATAQLGDGGLKSIGFCITLAALCGVVIGHGNGADGQQ